MTAPLSEQVASLEAERDDLQRQVQEARDEIAELRAGQGRWPKKVDDFPRCTSTTPRAPAKDVDRPAPSLKESGENFTRPQGGAAMTEQEEMVERLRFAIGKMSKWSGVDISDLIEDDYLKEGDMG